MKKLRSIQSRREAKRRKEQRRFNNVFTSQLKAFGTNRVVRYIIGFFKALYQWIMGKKADVELPNTTPPTAQALARNLSRAAA